jgi:transposase
LLKKTRKGGRVSKQYAWTNSAKVGDTSFFSQSAKQMMQKTAMAVDSKIDYFNHHKPTDKRSLPRNYRSRKDLFEQV